MQATLYENNALVRVDCHDCRGCSSCCRGMGDSIRLDPYDAYQFQIAKKPLSELLASGAAALTVWEGMILPHIQMQEQTESCPFLSAQGRCSIHAYRPGICRLFPLGRNFADGELTYFLLEDACKAKQRSKLRVSKWLGVEPAGKYHTFVKNWHAFRREMVAVLMEAASEQAKELNLYLLRTFFLQPYDELQDFYVQFEERVQRIRGAFAQEGDR